MTWPVVDNWVAFILGMAALVGALGVLWKQGIAPLMRAIWAAILAAPKIAESAGELVDLLNGKVIERLDEGSRRFAGIDERLEGHETRIGSLERREWTGAVISTEGQEPPR